MAKTSEVRAVAALLSQEHESVEVLAEQVIGLVDAERAKQKFWCAVVVNPSLGVCQVYSPFSTEKQVRKFAKKHVVKYDELTRGFVGRVIHPENVSE